MHTFIRSRSIRASALALLAGGMLVGLAAPAAAAEIVGPEPLPEVPPTTSEFFEYEGSLFYSSYGLPVDSIDFLHSYDGATVVPYADVSPASPSDFVEFEGELYFAGTSGAPRNLWAFGDGTPYVPTGSPDHVAGVTIFGETIVLAGTDGGPSQLYTFDGSAFTPVPGSPGSPSHLVASGDVLYFIGVDAGVQYLYEYDGVSASVVTGSSDANLVQPVAFDGAIYFSRYNGVDNLLHRYDGTTLEPVPDSPTFPSSMVVFEESLYLTGDVGGTFPLIRFDGTAFEPMADSPTDPENGFVYAGRLFFGASEGMDTRTLWSTDGAVFVEHSDLAWNPGHFVSYRGSLYFSAQNAGGVGSSVWRLTLVDPVTPGAQPVLPATGGAASPTVLLPIVAGTLALGAVALALGRRRSAAQLVR